MFLEGTKQFIVPLFQRTYSWKKKNVMRLWEDLVALSDSEPTHFFGSFVSIPIPTSASNVSKYTLIDGQQRLTSVALLLAAIRNRISELDSKSKRIDEINQVYLTNQFREAEKYKIVPTEADKEILFSIIRGQDVVQSDRHLLVDAFSALTAKLAEVDDITRLEELMTRLLASFLIVDVRLEREDDPYKIFESLNATGTPLTQADLIRNYIFMGIEDCRQQTIYDEKWFPIQSRLGEDLEAFFRHYMAMNGEIPNISSIYAKFREVTIDVFVNEGERESRIHDLLEKLKTHSSYYDKLLRPRNEMESSLREGLERINSLRLTTAYPLLLCLYNSREAGHITAEEFVKCVNLIETFVVRRTVCGIPTNILNRYFPTVFRSLDHDDMAKSLRNRFANETGASRMPQDEEFRKCLTERNLYGNRILRFILKEIEVFDNKEVVDFANLQVEHIMPRTLTDDWKRALGNNWDLTHRNYLNTLGNLTLTGYNPEYSNRSFSEKRDMDKGFKDSGLQINRGLAELDTWDEQAIKNRANELAEVAIKIWRI